MQPRPCPEPAEGAQALGGKWGNESALKARKISSHTDSDANFQAAKLVNVTSVPTFLRLLLSLPPFAAYHSRGVPGSLSFIENEIPARRSRMNQGTFSTPPEAEKIGSAPFSVPPVSHFVTNSRFLHSRLPTV
jgi:hypothetical protein